MEVPEGFRAYLTAWKETPNALVVMVNSDNGSILDEIRLAVAKEYKLPGIKPNIKKVTKLTHDQLKKYKGRYKIDELGEVDIFNLKEHLGAYADFIGDTVHILAENDSVFFDRDDGTPFKFIFKEDSASGFSVQRFTARRVE